MTAPPTLMLGHGWFPHQLGGLDRYYRDLFEHLPEARGVVIGTDAPHPPRLVSVSGHTRALARRLFAYWLAAQREADVVEVVDLHFALYGLLPLWLGRLRSKPVVLHFHGPWAHESVAAGDASAVRRRARLALERAAYRRADQAVTLTSAFRQVLVERYRVAPWIVNVEPPGVDLNRFSPGSRAGARETLGLAGDAFVAVAVRRLVPRMGLDVLLDAWRAARSEMPAGSTLLIAGDGPLRQELQRAAVEGDMADCVRLLGRVSDEQLVSLYRAADVAVVPSLEHEGFGLVVLEAAACGTPSIVSSVGGLPEAVAGLDRSLLVPPGDRDALHARLVRAMRETPSRAATRAYAERFEWSAVADRNREIARRARSRVQSRSSRGDYDRLRVVYLDHVARLSGGEIALVRLLPHLARVHAHVVLAEDGPLVGELHLAGISTEVLPLAAGAREVRKDAVRVGRLGADAVGLTVAYVLRLARRLRQLRPDLVHANSLKAGVYGSLAARLAGVPLVWHVRDRIAEDYLPAPAAWLIRSMARRLPVAVVANSQTTMATLGAPGHCSRVLPDALGEVPQHEPEHARPLTYGVLGRLAPWKGQDFFLRAFARAFPSSDERAVLIGGALFGEDDYAAQLPNLAARLGIAERVELRGHRSDVWTELARVDVLVHSSITAEPFGQVILEGMAAGVPVIAANAGGPTEILTHGVNGLLYKRADEQRLAESLRLMTDPELRDRLRLAATDTLGAYSPEVVAEQLQQLYSELLAGRRG